MRPGKSDSSVPNCSAMTSGAWFGSMMPPAPTRIVLSAAGDVPDDHRRRRAGDARHVVMLGQPVAAVAPALGVAREVERVAERLRGVAALDDRREVEDGKRDHWTLLDAAPRARLPPHPLHLPHAAAPPAHRGPARGIGARGGTGFRRARCSSSSRWERPPRSAPLPAPPSSATTPRSPLRSSPTTVKDTCSVVAGLGPRSAASGFRARFRAASYRVTVRKAVAHEKDGGT